MLSDPLLAVAPADGRYVNTCSELRQFFSEFALIRFRLIIEIEYFLHLFKLNLPQFPFSNHFPQEKIRQIATDFSIEDAQRIKEIESVTNHDVKAVEYFLKEKMAAMGLEKWSEWIHFGLTSQDINNTAVPLSIKECLQRVMYPQLENIQALIHEKAENWNNIPMLARTHGQAASPTRLGKEMAVFAERLSLQLASLKQIPIACKFGGATGNFNAHHVAFPNINWAEFGDSLAMDLGLIRYQTTTQIEHYDYLAALFDNLKRLNVILIDFCKDIWSYVSMDYFKQKIKSNEVGSSAMPHKVNPIDFENAEGNLLLSNALFAFFSEKLPISRLQRDLTDSTVSRNFGLAFAHQLIALKAIEKGIGKLLVNESAIENDLNRHYLVIAEAIQTVLRREGVHGAYELLKAFSRNHTNPGKEEFDTFIQELPVSKEIQQELLKITPFNYTGI